MKNSDRDRFDGRLKNASEAKQNRLKRFKASANSPEMLVKLANRNEAAAVREAKRQVKAANRLKEQEDLARQQAEDTRKSEEDAAVREAALEAERAEVSDQVIAQNTSREAERKAERDQRYAARQNRKR
ncbi:hypothetical protein SuNHUV7_26940 (plasmid) [Pseudoseohaeicola sp. NH-UV-7]|uniref:DUF6481 family protein n=1 Tax=Sulfitobacter sp. TBRI5 TaxID=2989732 RepID=UPI003A768B15